MQVKIAFTEDAGEEIKKILTETYATPGSAWIDLRRTLTEINNFPL